MVDIETGIVVDLLESRDSEKVTEWLKTYPNIEVVSRDGSQAYASAIAKAFPNAIQVSDRFHILKNLTEAVVLHFNKLFKGRIVIPMTPETTAIKRTILEKPTMYDKVLLVKKLYKTGKTKTEIQSITGFRPETIKKYLLMRDEEIRNIKETVRGRQHNEAVEKVRKKMEWVKKLYEEGNSIYDICKITGYVSKTVKKYLDPNSTPVNGCYGKRLKGLLYDYRDEVIELRSKGMKYKEITNIIRKKGYTGTVDALRVFMSKEKRIQNDLKNKQSLNEIELVERKWLIKLLFKPLCDVKGITENQFNAIIKQYPQAGTLYDIVRTFKEIMFSKDSDSLFSWMEDAESLNIAEIKSFVNGLKNDFFAVKNAIELDYNNGLAEGSVNKLKVIKRIMYGRNNFDLLRNKILLLENRKIN